MLWLLELLLFIQVLALMLLLLVPTTVTKLSSSASSCRHEPRNLTRIGMLSLDNPDFNAPDWVVAAFSWMLIWVSTWNVGKQVANQVYVREEGTWAIVIYRILSEPKFRADFPFFLGKSGLNSEERGIHTNPSYHDGPSSSINKLTNMASCKSNSWQLNDLGLGGSAGKTQGVPAGGGYLACGNPSLLDPLLWALMAEEPHEKGPHTPLQAGTTLPGGGKGSRGLSQTVGGLVWEHHEPLPAGDPLPA